MINKEDLILVGRIAKTHGNFGDVIAYIQQQKYTIVDKPRALFVKIDGNYIPFLITDLKQLMANQYLITLEDVDSPENAKELLVNQDFYLLSSDVQTESIIINEQVIGVDVEDVNRGLLGKVVDIMENPAHEILVIHQEKKEILLPVVEDFFLEVTEHKILVEVPDGLLDL